MLKLQGTRVRAFLISGEKRADIALEVIGLHLLHYDYGGRVMNPARFKQWT
jgi:hypothetical protein